MALKITKGKGNRLRFSLEEDERLIHEMGTHPCLFDAKNQFYKDQNIRDNTWTAIAGVVGKSVEDCKTRWKSLKDVYWKKKKGTIQGTGSAAKDIRKWEHMEALAFLENIERCRKSITNVGEGPFTPDIQNVVQNVDEESQDNREFKENESHLTAENESEDTSTAEIQEINDTPLVENTKVNNEKHNTENKNSCKRMKTTDKILEAINKRSEERTEIFKRMETLSKPPADKPHPIKTFFDSMAATVMTFPPALVVRAKKRVLEVISELELQSCASPSTSRNSASSYSNSSAMDTGYSYWNYGASTSEEEPVYLQRL